MTAVGAPLAIVAPLTRAAGRGVPLGVDRLAGGRNNRVYRVTMEEGEPLVLKLYHADVRDPRDRLGHEWTFLTHVWGLGVRAVPQPLGCDRERQAALMSFLPGSKLAAGEVAAAHVDAAIDFVIAINRPSPAFAGIAPGSEACFTLRSHLDAVAQRVRRLASLDPDLPQAVDAQAFVRDALAPMWDAVQARFARDLKAAGPDPERPLSELEICLSPSDFGFHNAFVEAGSVSFFDFEYAGRDDPAKLVCDFFCQPEVPVPTSRFDGFVDRIAAGLALDQAFRARCALLIDLYRIKWICIMLNEFVAVDASRRDFAAADSDARARRCAEQLAKAAQSLARMTARA